jgi:hypothetical protein
MQASCPRRSEPVVVGERRHHPRTLTTGGTGSHATTVPQNNRIQPETTGLAFALVGPPQTALASRILGYKRRGRDSNPRDTFRCLPVFKAGDESAGIGLPKRFANFVPPAVPPSSAQSVGDVRRSGHAAQCPCEPNVYWQLEERPCGGRRPRPRSGGEACCTAKRTDPSELAQSAPIVTRDRDPLLTSS